MTHTTARKQKLDPIYPENTEEGLRYFYDIVEGRYYDAATDLYMNMDWNPTMLRPTLIEAA